MSFWGLLSHSPCVCPSVLPSCCFYLDSSPQAMIFRWLPEHHISSPSPFLLPLLPYCRGTGTSAPGLQSLFPVISSRLMVFNDMSLLVTPKWPLPVWVDTRRKWEASPLLSPPPGTWERHVPGTGAARASAGGEVCVTSWEAATVAFGREDGWFGVCFWVTPWLLSGEWMEGANMLTSDVYSHKP